MLVQIQNILKVNKEILIKMFKALDIKEQVVIQMIDLNNKIVKSIVIYNFNFS